MDINKAFGAALRRVRKARNLTQEDFSTVSSRTYLSTLERGLKSPTLEKIDSLAPVLGVQPLTLLALTYLTKGRGKTIEKLLQQVIEELDDLARTPKE